MRKALSFSALALGLAACSDVSVPVSPTATTSSAGALRSSTHGTLIPGQYIIRFRDDVISVDDVAAGLAFKHAGKIKHLFRSAIKGTTLEMPDAAVAAVRADPNVISVEQDQIMTLSSTQTGATWGIDRVDQRTLPLSSTYVYNATGTGVTVYIIDTGIDFTHSEYSGRAFTGVDEITAGGNAADCNGHGSHVSGTVGGTTYGVAKNVKLVAVRVLDCAGSGSYSQVIAGVDWVTSQKNANPSVPSAANMSLGGPTSATLDQAVGNSVAAGVVFAVAAGNDGGDACLHSPAASPTAITVGATDINDGFASFSNRGSCVDINAPGVNITSAWYTGNTATNTISGTSMATPHVVGTIALYLEVNPTATPAQVDAALKANASTTSVPAGTTNKFLYSGFISAAPQPPVANFTSSCSALTCNFDGSSSSAQAGATYSWAFGDASSGSGVTTSHSYASAGSYTVTLTVTDANGSSSKTSTVSPAITPAPVAQFTKSCNNRTCTFNASATTNATSYSWNFGNGTTGSGVTVSHQFARNSNSTVTLTATGPGGTGTATKPVTCTNKTCS